MRPREIDHILLEAMVPEDASLAELGIGPCWAQSQRGKPTEAKIWLHQDPYILLIFHFLPKIPDPSKTTLLLSNLLNLTNFFPKTHRLRVSINQPNSSSHSFKLSVHTAFPVSLSHSEPPVGWTINQDSCFSFLLHQALPQANPREYHSASP